MVVVVSVVVVVVVVVVVQSTAYHKNLKAPFFIKKKIDIFFNIDQKYKNEKNRKEP